MARMERPRVVTHKRTIHKSNDFWEALFSQDESPRGFIFPRLA